MTLEQFFAKNREVAVAFSGGVDSAYLLYAAKRYAARVKAYYVSTAFQPAFELVDARRLELVGACYDPKAMLCTVGLKQPVDYTIANGKICVARGRLTGVDEEKLAQSAEREVRRYLA